MSEGRGSRRATRITRRRFLGTISATGAAVSTFTIAPASIIGGPAHVAPNDRIGAALIGCGGRGSGTFKDLQRRHDLPTEKLAVCDVDRRRLSLSTQIAHKNGEKSCEGYTDFRRVLERTDIDVVAIATPPHWHALISIAAMESGKDVLCEKPMTRFIAEGRAVVQASERYGRVFQIGTNGRFRKSRDKGARRMRKILTSGVFDITDAVHIIKGGFKARQWSGLVNAEPRAIPDWIDWDLYQGPSPKRPFHPHRHGGSHRGYWD